MTTINVKTKSGEYPVMIGMPLLDSGDVIRRKNDGCRAVIVSDTNVAPLYGDILKKSLEKKGYDTAFHIIPAGEEHKTLSAVEGMYRSFYENGLTRRDLAVALGGGVVGDMTGFAAGTYLRGIDCLQVPTTLLAQVDSSVGGKTGVDMPWGKNLVGVFHQPAAVVADQMVFKTLSFSLIADGMAEAIKCGAILDKGLFYDISNGRYDDDKTEMVVSCIDIKRQVVEADEREAGLRMLLNFGHTMGHAIEAAGEFKRYSHGAAVASGMLYAADFGEKLKMTPPGVYSDIKKAISRFGFSHITADKKILYNAVTADKKRRGDKIHFVLLEDIGKAVVVPLSLDEVEKLLFA